MYTHVVISLCNCWVVSHVAAFLLCLSLTADWPCFKSEGSWKCEGAVKTAEMNQQTFCLCKPRAVSLLSLFPLPLLSCFSATPASGNSNLSHISPWALEESRLERKWQVRRKLNHCAWVHLLHFVHVSRFCFPVLAAFLQSTACPPPPPTRKQEIQP